MHHLLDIENLTDTDIERLLARAFLLEAQLGTHGWPAPRPGVLINLFFEPSTRTRASFAVAAARVGLSSLAIDQATSSTRKGETLDDTFMNLAAMGPEIMVIRHSEAGEPARLAQMAPAGTHIVNAGDGTHAHPTQALSDAFSLQKAGVDISSSCVVIAGDLKHSRVARSNIALLHRLGVKELRLAAPEQLQLSPAETAGAEQFGQFDRAIEGADVIMMLRVQHERIGDIDIPDAGHWHHHWGLNSERLRRAAPNCKVMHPGPMNRGVEITSDVADGPSSLILEQVRNGVFMRSAVILELLEIQDSHHD